MGEEGGSFGSSTSGSGSWPPIGSPLLNSLPRDDDPWRSNFDNSVNAVSFGFVATAILISMFLVMAIFERFLRPTTTSPPAAAPSNTTAHADLEAQLRFNPKLGHPSPKMTVYASGVSVLMPGDHIPTFIAHPAPVPYPHESISRPHHQHNPLPNPTTNSNSPSTM